MKTTCPLIYVEHISTISRKKCVCSRLVEMERVLGSIWKHTFDLAAAAEGNGC